MLFSICGKEGFEHKSSKKAMAVDDWSDVPWDLIYLLAKRMAADISDLVTMGAVCKSWRSHLHESQWLGYGQQLEALTGLPSLHLPKLMVPDETDNCLAETRDFFDWGMGRTFQINLPEARGRRCCGSNNGWLVTAKDHDVYLLNLITREQIRLPSQISFGGFFDLGYVGKAIIVGNPCKPGDCVVAAAFAYWLAITKPGPDNAWTMVTLTDALPAHNIACHRGLLYCVTCKLSCIEVWSVNPVRKMRTICLASPIRSGVRLLYSYCLEVYGEIIGVVRPMQGEGEVVVVKLKDDCRWVEVTDLGDCCLFLGRTTSTALSPVPPGSGFRRNCIYFAHTTHFERGQEGRYSVLVYSLEDKLYQPFYFGKSVSYVYTPSIWVAFMNDHRRGKMN